VTFRNLFTLENADDSRHIIDFVRAGWPALILQFEIDDVPFVWKPQDKGYVCINPTGEILARFERVKESGMSAKVWVTQGVTPFMESVMIAGAFALVKMLEEGNTYL